MSADNGPRPPEGAFKLADRLARESEDRSRESRDFQRHKLTVEVEVQPVDAKFKPVGEPFVAVTQDISTGGLGFIHTRAVNHKFLCIALREALWEAYRGKVFVLEVVRCDPVGSLYTVGGRFVGKIDDPRGQNKSRDTVRLDNNSRQRRRHIAKDVKTPIASDATLESQLREVDRFIPVNHDPARFGDQDLIANRRRKNKCLVTWLAAGLLITGVIGGGLCWACMSGVITSTRRTASVQQVTLAELANELSLDEDLTFEDEPQNPGLKQPEEAQGDSETMKVAPTVHADIAPIEASSVMPIDKPEVGSRKITGDLLFDGDRELPSLPTSDNDANSAADLFFQPPVKLDGGEGLMPLPTITKLDPMEHEQRQLERLPTNTKFGEPHQRKKPEPSTDEPDKRRAPERVRTRAELELLYFMYADMKGWDTSEKAVQAKVDSWERRKRGSVGLAIRFFETGEDGAKKSGRNAEIVYKSMPPAYWPFPARTPIP